LSVSTLTCPVTLVSFLIRPTLIVYSNLTKRSVTYSTSSIYNFIVFLWILNKFINGESVTEGVGSWLTLLLNLKIKQIQFYPPRLFQVKVIHDWIKYNFFFSSWNCCEVMIEHSFFEEDYEGQGYISYCQFCFRIIYSMCIQFVNTLWTTLEN